MWPCVGSPPERQVRARFPAGVWLGYTKLHSLRGSYSTPDYDHLRRWLHQGPNRRPERGRAGRRRPSRNSIPRGQAAWTPSSRAAHPAGRLVFEIRSAFFGCEVPTDSPADLCDCCGSVGQFDVPKLHRGVVPRQVLLFSLRARVRLASRPGLGRVWPACPSSCGARRLLAQIGLSAVSDDFRCPYRRFRGQHGDQ